MTDVKISYIPVTSIRPYNRNPRKNKKAIDLLVKAIQQYGFTTPITVDKDCVIVTGHSRYAAARQLGYEELPVIVLDLPKHKIDAYRIADNSAADHTRFDPDALAERLSEDAFIDDKEFLDYFYQRPILTGNEATNFGVINPALSDNTETPVVYSKMAETADDDDVEDDIIPPTANAGVGCMCPHCLHEFELP